MDGLGNDFSGILSVLVIIEFSIDFKRPAQRLLERGKQLVQLVFLSTLDGLPVRLSGLFSSLGGRHEHHLFI